MKNIVLPGVYCGFEPVPGDGLFVRITSEKTEGRGAASVDVGKCQISVQQVSDVVVPVEAGVTTIIVLEANYEHGVKTSQVDSSSDISAARIIALVDEGIASNQIELCRVIVPDNAQAVTADMISTKYRANRAVGVEFSSALDSDEEYKAATPLAISTLNKLKAPVDSPEFIGIPTSPTPEQGTNSTQIANAAFVQAAITALIDGSPSALDTLKKIADAINNDPQFSQTINDALALKAPLLSPAFTGVPTAPTASQGTNNTQIATTAYVRAAISALVGSSPEALDTLNELAAALGNDPNFATTMTNALAGKQPLDATLTALAGLATGANKLPYFTGTDTVAQTDLTSVGRDILAKTSTLAVIQYLGLRELGTSGEKLPLLSTANTWSARQTFSAGITGTLTGNADTATKLKTARKINGVAFDGSADITLTPEDLGLTDIASQAGNAVQRSGDTMGGQLKIGTINALRIFNQDFGLIFRRSEESLHLIPTNEGEGENGDIGPLRPFAINLRTGLVSIGNGVTVSGGITGNLTGNADTATKLKTARTIGGVSFDGSANIDLPGVNKTGNQSTTGNAATATKLQTARTIGGVSFDGSANINLPGVNIAGNQNTTGNAATATKLQTARTIGGVSFDGSANINLPGVNIAGNQNTTGNAATATKLQTARTINGVNFDGSANISIPTITSRGRVTALTGTTQGAAAGLQMYEAYNNGYPSAYGNVLHLKGATVAGEGELFIGWSGTSGAHAPVHVRSRRDTDTASWSEWAQVYTSKDSIPGVNTTGNQNTTGNAASATKLQTARTIGGVSFDGSANIDLPGVNKTGNQSTTGNAATATKLQTARTINGVSFDGTANISLSPANIGCPASPTGWLETGDNGASITTEQLVTLLRDNGAFNAKVWIARCAWAYANSASIPDSETGCGIIPLAGAVIEVFNNSSSTSYFTIRITTATTTSVSGALTNAEFIYVSNGTSYSPGWRRAYNTKNKPTAADVGALPLSGGSLTGGLTAAGEIISKSANGLRIAYGNYGFFIRNDGSSTYFMLTASGDNLGTWNSLRPLTINNANGAVSIGNGLNVTGGINGSLNGNAATATKLQTARTIGGVSFDGTANINLPGVNIAGNQNTSGNAATATKLKTARKISGVAFDGSADITLTASHVGALPTTGGTVTGEIISSSQNAIRLTYNNNYGFLITNTGYSFQISTTGQNVNGDVVYTPLKIDGGDGRVELGRADGHVRVMGNLSAVGQITPGNYSNFNTKYQAKNTAYANIHGWHKDTSTKVMMQWGFITNLTPGSVVNFPTTFPEACAVVVISPHSGNAVNSILYTYNHSATGFTVKSSSTDKIYAQYVAYGY
ncbi:beta strand repeat-containing protein [Escherichia coli]|uniref:beta strand repeat-containing protein n=1 Tax=Escherichia coli TaxID=562 RepID=UPI0039197F64